LAEYFPFKITHKNLYTFHNTNCS